MVKSVLDHLKPYINPELYYMEKEPKEESKEEHGTKNAIFSYQSKIGRTTGKAQSPRWLREALAKHFAEIKNKRMPKKVVWSDDPNVLG